MAKWQDKVREKSGSQWGEEEKLTFLHGYVTQQNRQKNGKEERRSKKGKTEG